MNTFGQRRWIIATTALFLVCLAQSVLGETATISLSIEPTSPTFIEGEPIQIVMNFKNDGEKNESIDLGGYGTENIKVIVEDEHSREQTAEGKLVGGFGISVSLNIKPKTVQSQRFVLDELLAIRKAGRYQLTIQIKNTSLVSNKAEFQILPSDSKSATLLREKYEQLWKTITIPLTNQNQQYALKMICLSRHEAAVEYQKQFVFGIGRGIYGGLWNDAVASLICTRDPEIVKLLVKNFLDRKDLNQNQQRHVLYRLRLEGAHQWDEQRYKELIPYKEMIKNAASISSTPSD